MSVTKSGPHELYAIHCAGKQLTKKTWASLCVEKGWNWWAWIKPPSMAYRTLALAKKKLSYAPEFAKPFLTIVRYVPVDTLDT